MKDTQTQPGLYVRNLKLKLVIMLSVVLAIFAASLIYLKLSSHNDNYSINVSQYSNKLDTKKP